MFGTMLMATTLTPTTWNPSDKSANVTLSNGNLTAAVSASAGSVRSIFSASTGKYYWEVTIQTAGDTSAVGIGKSTMALTNFPGRVDANGWGYASDGGKWNNGSGPAYGSTYTNGDVISVALNMTTGKVWFAKNGVWQASGDPAAGTNEAFSGLTGPMFAAVGANDARTSTANFGATAFTYTVPTGFTRGFGQ